MNRDALRAELRSLVGERKADFEDICVQKSPVDRCDGFVKFEREVLRSSSLCYIDGQMRHFGGEIYERCEGGAVMNVLRDLLLDLGASPSDLRRAGDMAITVVSEREYDGGPLLAFTNGVLDMRRGGGSDLDAVEAYRRWTGDAGESLGSGAAGEFRGEFTASLPVTERVDYAYDRDADCPMWKDFLEQVLPDESLRADLQEFFGMCYLDRSKLSVEKFALLVGRGANGKSVIFDVMKRVIGADNVISLDSQQLTDERMVPYLRGRRLNFAPDVRSSAAFESSLKALASGQDVIGRKIYGDAVTVKAPPLCFAMNEVPRFRDVTQGFFRRVLLFPFDVTIAPDKQDRRLAEKICASDLPGVFNWVMEGRRRLEESGGRFTRSVRMERQLTLLSKDESEREIPVLGWMRSNRLAAEPVRDGQSWTDVSQAEIVRSFHGSLSAWAVTAQMRRLGVGYARVNGKVYYRLYKSEY